MEWYFISGETAVNSNLSEQYFHLEYAWNNFNKEIVSVKNCIYEYSRNGLNQMAQMYLNAFSVPGNMLRLTKNVEMLYYNCENTDYSHQD